MSNKTVPTVTKEEEERLLSFVLDFFIFVWALVIRPPLMGILPIGALKISVIYIYIYILRALMGRTPIGGALTSVLAELEDSSFIYIYGELREF